LTGSLKDHYHTLSTSGTSVDRNSEGLAYPELLGQLGTNTRQRLGLPVIQYRLIQLSKGG